MMVSGLSEDSKLRYDQRDMKSSAGTAGKPTLKPMCVRLDPSLPLIRWIV